jgi:hypothetical protein
MNTPARQPAWPLSHWDVKQGNPAEVETCAELVLEAYTRAVRTIAGKQDAFIVAMRVWRERNPNASPEMVRPAVATILCREQ